MTLADDLKDQSLSQHETGEERRLGELARGGDPEARELLLRSTYMLILKIASNATNTTVSDDEFDDLVLAGVEGALNAIDSYDPDSGTKLSTWAFPHIRGKILRAMSWRNSVLKVSHTAMTEYLSALKQEARGETDALSPTKISAVVSAVNNVDSIDGMDLELVADTEHQTDLRYMVDTILDELPPLEQFVICHSFSLRGFGYLSKQAIASTYKVSITEVRRAYKEGLARMEEALLYLMEHN